MRKFYLFALFCLMGMLVACVKDEATSDPKPDGPENPDIPASEWRLATYSDPDDYPDVPRSTVYAVTLIQGDTRVTVPVFQSSCPVYQAGYMDMTPTDAYPLEIFKGRSISWANFSFYGRVDVEVKVLDHNKVSFFGGVKVLPSRYGVEPTVDGDVVRFSLTRPGQCSVEIGFNGYKNGLVLFANPMENDVPETTDAEYTVLDHATASDVVAVPTSSTGLYFKSGVHDIGVYRVPAHIRNIYLEGGAWVYGSIIMDGRPGVRIFGRGVLSQGRMKYRESHMIEAINGSDNITVEGITLADNKYFSVRLIGKGNTVRWTKIIGAWTYNCDGISAFAGSSVSNCFVWANDDNIKAYRDDVTFSDMVLWQLNNGGCIQMSWGGATAANVAIRRVDILHAEWNNAEVNRGVLSCVGDKYQSGKSGYLRDWVIEDLVTETAVPLIFRISPDPYSPCPIHGLVMRDWKVRMNTELGFSNYIIGNDPTEKFDGFVFGNVSINGTRLTEANWMATGNFEVSNLEPPIFE